MAAKKTSKKSARKATKKKKCPIMEPDPFTVWVDWRYTYCSGGEIVEGQEDDDYPSRETEHKDHEVNAAFSQEAYKGGRGHWDSYDDGVQVSFEPVSGSKVWAVVVTYSNGDTFGSSSGNVSIVGVYDDEGQADSIAKDIRDDDSADIRRDRSKKKPKEKFTGFKAWDGYFSGLEGVEVHRLVLDEGTQVKRF